MDVGLIWFVSVRLLATSAWMFLGGGPLQEDDSDSGIVVGEEVDEDNGTLLAVFSE